MGGLFGFFSGDPSKEDLSKGLQKTRESFLSRLAQAVTGKPRLDAEALEEALIACDIGPAAAFEIIERVQRRFSSDRSLSIDHLNQVLKEEVVAMLPDPPTQAELLQGCRVGLMVGVNGAGKTTTIGKLAAQLIAQGKSVTLGAADTFRAAAVEQLQLWGQRVGARVVSKPMGADPSSVAYEAVKQGLETHADVVLIDTAGRLHTKTNLMGELAKIQRVIGKALPGAPHETLLTLDGGSGQNAIIQAREFAKAVLITGIVVTKLDGTAKGGVVIGIANELGIPVRYIGVGEQPDQLRPFDKAEFAGLLFDEN